MPLDHWMERAKKLAQGVIDIAELAMPESIMQTDSRVLLARQTLKELRTAKSAEDIDYERSMQRALSQAGELGRAATKRRRKRSNRGRSPRSPA